jgi:hypothetical protein
MVKKIVNHPTFSLNWILALAAVGMVMPAMAQKAAKPKKKPPVTAPAAVPNVAAQRLGMYKKFELKTDTALLSTAERECVTHLIKAAEYADLIFWKQTIGDKADFLKGIKDPNERKFAEINYGPWDRLNNDEPFIKGYASKPAGANFYPKDFTVSGIDTMFLSFVREPYSVVRDFKAPGPIDPSKHKNGPIMPEPMGMPFQSTSGKQYQTLKYGEIFREEVMKLGDELNAAAEAIKGEDPEFAEYLRLRMGALMMDDYTVSDIKWLSLKSHLDLVIGPIENYEDKLYGQKTSYEAYVLVRDKAWDAKLEKFIAYLPKLQSGLPVEPEYKPSLNQDEAGSDHAEMTIEPGFPPREPGAKPLSQLAVFDVVYYGGDCNSGSKTIAVNLPNDERIQKYYGTRRSQLRNTMQAKFENMVVPIAANVIAPSQQKNITFNAFFNNVMFHEVAHGLGIKNVVGNDKLTVREALGADYSAIEECKADVLGLYMVTQLFDENQLEGSLQDYYVTFVASVFRSVRFGASSAHGKANMITFNTLLNQGAIVLEEKGKPALDGGAEKRTYRVDVDKMRKVISDLAGELLRLQGNGNVADVKAVLNSRGVIGASLQMDLKRIEKAGIPVDLVFDQGIKTLGLEKFYKPLPEMQGMPLGNPGGPGMGGPGGQGAPGMNGQGGPGMGGQGGPGMGGPGGQGGPGGINQGAPHTPPPPAPKGPGKI